MKVSLRDVIGEMDALGDDHTAYLNPKTGELITLTEEDYYILENDEPPEDLPEWQRGMLPKIREVVESGDFLELPSKFDIHEYSIMERFCYSVQDSDQREELLKAIRGRGAFRYFKDTIYRFGIAEDWYHFRYQALEEIAIDWLKSNNIAYKKATRSS